MVWMLGAFGFTVKSHHLRKAQPVECLLQFSVARIDLDLYVQTSAPTQKSCLFPFLYPNSWFLFSLKYCTLHQGVSALQPPHRHTHQGCLVCCPWPPPRSLSATLPAQPVLGPGQLPTWSTCLSRESHLLVLPSSVSKTHSHLFSFLPAQ